MKYYTKILSCPSCRTNLFSQILEEKKNRDFTSFSCHNCGQQVYVVCPSCSTRCKYIETNCSACGLDFYNISNKVDNMTAKKTDEIQSTYQFLNEEEYQYSRLISVLEEWKQIKIKKEIEEISSCDKNSSEYYLKQILRDAHDNSEFAQLLLQNLLSYHPIQQRLKKFIETVNQFTGDNPKNELITIIDTALDELKIEEFIPSIQDFSQMICGTMAEFCCVWDDYHKELTFPASPSYITKPARENADALISDMFDVYDKIDPTYKSMMMHLVYLIDNFDEFANILSRSRYLEFLVGMGAGLVGEPIASKGARYWAKSRDLSERKFLESYFQTIDLFIESGIEYMDSLKELSKPVFQKTGGLMRRHYEYVYECALLQKEDRLFVQNVYEVCRQNQEPSRDSLWLMNLTLLEMKENGMSEESYQNLRSIYNFGDYNMLQELAEST